MRGGGLLSDTKLTFELIFLACKSQDVAICMQDCYIEDLTLISAHVLFHLLNELGTSDKM